MRLIGSVFILLILFSACNKSEQISTDSTIKLNFDRDSILFDTIFTSFGSTTKRIKIKNTSNSAVNISEIKLSGADQSPFSININGIKSNNATNIFLGSRDSINVFVKVTINPNDKNLAFLVQDSIILNTNGNRQAIQLLAYGQNAVFVNNSVINQNTNWNSALPYLVNGSVTIKEGSSLSISAGAKIYFHKDAELNVEGSLTVNGTLANPALLGSDRLEKLYANEAGQWKGIYLKKTGTGVINYAIIKNASVGITSDSLSLTSKPKLILSHTIIKNMQVAAYIGYHSELLAFNNLIYNCGNYLVYGVGGGNYNLKQNTFAGYNPSFARKNAALTFSDYLSSNKYNQLQIDLTNNIIYGSLTNELDIQKKTSATVQLKVWNNLIKSTSNSFHTNNNILNNDPGFINKELEDFQLSENSVATKKGINLTSDPNFSTYLSLDLINNTRTFPSSLGCYEKK